MTSEDVAQNSANKVFAPIDRRSQISRRELLNEYILPGLPVILTGACDAWEAMGKITPEYLKVHYGHLTKTLMGKVYTLAEYVDLLATSTPENPVPYPFNIDIEAQMPELLNMMKPEIVYGRSDRINHPLLPRYLLRGTVLYELFLGGNGARFPYLHFDALCMHTQITQLYGAKEFILFSPEQTPYLYPNEHNPKASMVNVFEPDYEKFPLFREAKPLYVTVGPGETFLFPTGWWHTTQIHEPCISMGRAQLNGANWNNFADDIYHLSKDNHPVLSLLAMVYAKIAGKVIDIQESFS